MVPLLPAGGGGGGDPASLCPLLLCALAGFDQLAATEAEAGFGGGGLHAANKGKHLFPTPLSHLCLTPPIWLDLHVDTGLQHLTYYPNFFPQ